MGEMIQIIRSKISQEKIILPYQDSRWRQRRKELRSILAETTINQQLCFSIRFVDFSSTSMQSVATVFGYNEAVEQLKQNLTNMVKRDPIKTFKLNSLTQDQVSHMCRAYLS